MATSIRETSRRQWLRFAQFLTTQTSISVRVSTMRAAIIGALVVGVMVCAPAQNARLRSTEASQDCPQPGAKVDLAFIIDRSGSLDVKAQGQTYNVEIEGVRRAILDPSLIPRDGSIAVSVFTFAGGPSLRVSFTEIKSEADAAAVAAAVEALKCVAAETCPLKGPNPESNAGLALLAANQHLSDNKRAGARRVLLMSTDGGFTDPDFAETASSRIRESTLEIASEVDVILLGLFAKPDSSTETCPPTDAGELDAAKAKVKRIVFPEPDSDLPGARLDISGGACNCPNAVFGSDCERQVRDFVELTRRVLRSQPATRFLTVNTDADTDPGTPIGSTLSLRQAIERANSNGGATTITFDSGLKDKTIRPRVPLPALIAPDIRICGCNETNCDFLIKDEPACDPFLTIDGSLTDTTKGEQHSDGILIGSDRDVVRGLRIINFSGAGVSLEPKCPSGNPRFNRIECNRLENNKKAGVRVLDSPANPGHNIGNTILGNTILDSLDCATPIDLGGDGRTDNDLCDADDGPNTLLNFPRIITVTESANNVTVTGSVCDPTCAEEVCPPNLIGAVVEIFAITRIETNCAARPANGETALQGDPDNRVITGVMPLARGTTDTNGSFTISGVGVSPTCGYTATVTDLEGNTSELMFPGVGFAKAKTTNLDFKDFEGVADPNQHPQSGTFTIENTGFEPLAVSFASIRRDGFPQNNPKQLARSDDSEHFSIQSIVVGSGQTIAIQPGQTQTFTATFNPAIPRVLTGDKPTASLILPDTVNSTITLGHNGCVGSDTKVSLTGHVNTAIKLIDPNNPRNDPLVTLSRSGDVFTVVFSIYDSNLDVGSVIYEFFDQAGGRVDLNQPLRDLSSVVEQARADGKLQIGQSFSIKQTFTNAKKHRNVATVTVTVSDKAGSKATASGAITALASTASAQSLLDAGGEVLVLPVVKLKTASHRKAQRAVGATSSSGTHQKWELERRGESRSPRSQGQARERRIKND